MNTNRSHANRPSALTVAERSRKPRPIAHKPRHDARVAFLAVTLISITASAVAFAGVIV
jgi:hypothetical protein